MKIKEIMSHPVVTVEKEATIKECGDLFEARDINGAPVVQGDHVVGVITRADIFRSILPRYPEIYKDERHLGDLGYLEGRIDEVTKMKVSEIMASPAMTLDQETSILKAGSILTLRRIKQMPVMDDDKLTGIITLKDIFRFVMERAGKF
jgi:predicted transcriptional regulator